ncbi:MAG: ABC transporter ATP-binding protein/permease [Gammaproteobacteria bacterium]|nr:ABC transporter ATP-binding protein/permease [Gammaproteobacteria bacterium]
MILNILKNRMMLFLSLFQTHQYFYSYIKENKKLFHRLFGVIFLLAVSNTAMIWLLGRPFDFLASGDYSGLVGVLFSLLVVIIVNQLLHYVNTYRANVLGLLYVGELRTQLMKNYVRSFRLVTDDVAKGDLLSRLSQDVDTMQRFVVELPLYLASHVFTIILYATMLIYINWQLALIAALLTPAFLVHQKFFSKNKRHAAKCFFDENGRLLAKEEEILGNIRLINALNCQEKLENQHKKAFKKAFKWAVKERRLDAIFTSSLAIVIYFCALIIVYLGVDKVESGDLSIAGLVSFLLYMGYMSVPLRGITQLVFQAQSDSMVGTRLSTFLSEKDVDEKHNKDVLIVKKGEITFDHVSLSFNDKVVFNNLSFTIEPGKTTAIVGGSGVGKSTLANLLLCFIKPDSGAVMIDQQNLAQVSADSVREGLGMVWQSPLLFNDTIKNNLLLANSEATDEMINIALKDSDASDFVGELSDGINTVIGTSGVILSAGQKQRLHIAQAFLRNSSILIMDEASSALDSESEQKLVNNIKRLRKGKTTLLIAHRYSSLRYADSVIYLNKDGTVIKGTHEELLKSHSDYEYALNWQAGN